MNKSGGRLSWLGAIGLTGVSIFVSLAVIELALRTAFPIYQTSILRAYQYDQELGVRLREGIHLLETTDHLQELRVNRIGTVNFQEHWDDYPVLVFALGDSFTQGVGVPADMSYPAQLDLTLNANEQGYYVKKYGIINLGLAAYGGEQSLIALRRWATTVRQPRIILYLGCDNDYGDDLRFKSGYVHRHIVEGSPLWGRFVAPMQWLTNDLQTGLRLKLFLSQLRNAQFFATPTVKSEADRPPSIAELERPILEQLVEYARGQHATLVLGWSTTGPSYDWLKAWTTDNSVRFADWKPKADSVISSIPTLPTQNPHSAGHHRGWLYRVIADEFARQVRTSGH